MLFRKSPEKFWNLISSLYASSPISDMKAYQTKIEKIKSYLSRDDVLLDIGCGTGTQCDDLAGNIKQATGIDISRKLLAIAEKRRTERKLENVEFIQTTVFDERFQAESFNVVMAFFVLHFYDDIESVIARIHSLLKPGGLFISETACLGENARFANRLAVFAGRLGLLPNINPLRYQQIEQALEQAGFELLEKTKFSSANDAEYTLVARKGA